VHGPHTQSSHWTRYTCRAASQGAGDTSTGKWAAWRGQRGFSDGAAGVAAITIFIDKLSLVIVTTIVIIR
jgi:hypothetical protein